MKKHVLASLLPLALLLAFLPVSAMAAQPEYEAKIGEQGYSTLAEAIGEAEAGETVTLVKDCELSGVLTVEKGVILDVADKTLSFAGEAVDDSLLVFAAGDSAITGTGKIVDNRTIGGAAGHRMVTVTGPGTSLTVDGVAFQTYRPSSADSPYYNYILRVENGASLTLNNGAALKDEKSPLVETANEKFGETTWGANGVSVFGNSTLTVNEGATIQTMSFAIAGNGSDNAGARNTTIVVNGGNVTSTNAQGIYHPQIGGKLTINGGTITGVTGIEMRAGTLEMKNGKVIGTGIPAEFTANGNGSTSTGVGIAIAQHTTKKDVTVYVTGGEIQGYAALYESDPQGNGEALELVEITISGGEFTAAEMAAPGQTESPSAIVAANPETLKVSGGSFSTEVDEKYCAPGFVPVTEPNGEGKYTVEMGEANTVQVLAADGVTVKGAYGTIDAAIAAAGEGEAVKLLEAVERTATLNVDKTLTIDLNGCHITGKNVRAIWVKSGTLTLTGEGTVTTVAAETDPVAAASSVIRVGDNSGSAAAGLVIDKEVTVAAPATYGVTAFGSATKETVTVRGKVIATGGASAISGNGTDTATGADITIEVGAVVSAVSDAAIYHPQAGALTIKGGEITGPTAIEIKGGELKIEGEPTIKATGEEGHEKNNNGVSTCGYAIALVNNTAYGTPGVTVSNGNYTGKVAIVDDDEPTEEHPSGTIAISGGSFDQEVKAEYCAEDFVPAKNSDGSYTVAKLTDESGESTVTLAPATLYVGETATLVAKVDGKTVEATFEVADGAEFVTLDAGTGKITGKSVGKVTISVTIDENAPINCELTVSTAPVAVPTYPVTVTEAENGDVKASRTYATEGETITLTVIPNEGYKLSALTVTAAGRELTLTDTGDGKYTFVMPGSKVTVIAAFVVADVVDCPRDDTCPAAVFGDLDLNSWSHDGIHYCVEKGLMNGMTATEFAPSGTLTRGMLVTILYRHAGSPAAGGCDFTDVAQGAWFTDAIAWAAGNGIVNGYGNGAFGPGDPITREQMATILYRYARSLGQNVTELADLGAYTDGSSTSDFAKAAMAWCVKSGILNGYTDGTIKPAGTATREEVATVLMRFCER